VDFKSYSLQEIAKIKYGKSQKNVEIENGKIPIYGTGGITGYASKSLCDKPSVLIPRKGSISKVKYIDIPFWTIDTLFYTEVDKDIIIPKYLYYLMLLIDLSQYNEGTTIPSLTQKTMNTLEFSIPPLNYQEKVITILSTLEEKILINTEINSNLPYILSQALLYYYSKEKISDIKSLTEFLIDDNPLKLFEDEKTLFYKSNMIELIKSAALSMTPTKKWSNEHDVSGGILTVKNDGMILFHHVFYNKKQLDKYLYQNTKFETGSTSRYNIGDIYKIDGKNSYYFKLNLQIRIK
jgi:type I restriction enzyme S subunit